MLDQKTLDRHAVRGLLFDLDGTLLDSFPAHYEAYRIMFGRLGVEISRDEFLAAYSPNWYHTYRMVGLATDVWDLANQYWLEAAAQLHSELFPGVADMLAHLGRSYRLGIVTSGSKDRVLRDLERTGIGSIFDVIITGDDIEHPKPAPEGLERALATLDMATHEVVYVGDALADFEMARALGVRFFGVPSQYDNLDNADALHKLESIRDLLHLFGD